MANIKSFALFKNNVVGAKGTAGTLFSDNVDLTSCDISVGRISFSYSIAATSGAPGTAGSSIFVYSGCTEWDGDFIVAGTFGTQGAIPHSNIISINSPNIAPYMRFGVITGTSNPVKLTGEVHII